MGPLLVPAEYAMTDSMPDSTAPAHDDGPASCAQCHTAPEIRVCTICGARARIIDCGHMAQPRPVAAGGRAGADYSCDSCEEQAESESCSQCGQHFTDEEWAAADHVCPMCAPLRAA